MPFDYHSGSPNQVVPISSTPMIPNAKPKAKTRSIRPGAQQAASRASDVPRAARTRHSARLLNKQLTARQSAPAQSDSIVTPFARQSTPGPSHLPTPQSTPSSHHLPNAARLLTPDLHGPLIETEAGCDIEPDLLDSDIRKGRWQWMKSVRFFDSPCITLLMLYLRKLESFLPQKTLLGSKKTYGLQKSITPVISTLQLNWKLSSERYQRYIKFPRSFLVSI